MYATLTTRALALSAVAFFCVLTCVAGNTYTLADDYLRDTSALFTDFAFFTDADPTGGFVKYVDRATAISTSLIAVLDGTSTSPFSNGTQSVYVGVDSTNITPAGRPSVRLTSKKSYNAGTLMVLDVAHMPAGCGTWPAFWAVGPDWPRNGEIDIVEGVNLQSSNAMTLHTAPGCTIANATSTFSGTLNSADCDSNLAGNQGCGISASSALSYGSAFNAAGGGVFVTEFTAHEINIWFFSAASSIPSSLFSSSSSSSSSSTSSGVAAQLSTSSLGTPAAHFTNATCDFSSHFKDLQIVLDTTLCGDWAGADAVWTGGGCAAKTGVAKCRDYVANHPEAFEEAFWSVRGLAVYEAVGDGAGLGKRAREWVG